MYKSHIECDGKGEHCKKTTRINQETWVSGFFDAFPSGWLWVRRSFETEQDLHFCSWNCMMQFIVTNNLEDLEG